MLSMCDVVRMHMGHIVAPGRHRLAGLVTTVEAYVVPHPDGLILFDTGIGYDPEVDRDLRIVRTPLWDAMKEAGFDPADVRLIVNCHLHFDHSGENFRFPGVPIFVQHVELNAAKAAEYTLPDVVFNFEGAHFEPLEGSFEIAPGASIIPTPGHTDGHQSLLLETSEGRLLLAGQAYEYAHDYAEWAKKPDAPAWMSHFAELDLERVLFAHDVSTWVKPSPA
ncbi:MAG: hypothetical protein NVSMB57_00490 [Actinomycetota bacterium]